MNPNYNYPHIHLWDDETWAQRVSPIKALTDWMGKHDSGAKAPVDESLYAGKGSEECYVNKTFSYNVPELLAYWDAQGIRFECREMGGTRWISMVPVKCYEDKETRVPALLVLHQEDYNDLYWAMHTVQHFARYNEAAAREGFALLYVTAANPDMAYNYAGVLNESVDLFPVDPGQIWLDVSLVKAQGVTLKETGLDVEESAISSLGGVPAVNVSRLWQSSGDNWLWMTSNSSADFDRERYVHSAMGEKTAYAADIEYSYTGPEDPKLAEFFKAMGVVCTCHDHKGHRWASAVPTVLPEGKKLPVMLIFQEVNYASDYFLLHAYAQYFEFIRLAAAGELIALFFARESPENNDLFRDIFEDAAQLYPVDRSRVYVTGHSHNGNFAMEFMRRNPDMIAAVAALGDQPGMPDPADCIEPVRVTEDKIELMQRIDIPVANISGMCEMGNFFPIGLPAQHVRPGFFCQLTELDGRIRTWRRRLKAFRIEDCTAEEMVACVTEGDYVTRKLGIPGGRKSLQYIDGFEHYIADFDNVDGKWRLRIVGIENMPHMPVPSMAAVAWDFVRRFARDPVSGDIVELC